MELRPLGFGEIFDRAITLYIRNFIPFAGIVAVVVVPLAVLQYLIDVASIPQFDQTIKILTHLGQAESTPPIMPAFMTDPRVAILFVVTMIVVYAIYPFALNAVAVGVARLYRSRPVLFAPCYRASLRRWPQVLGMLLLEFAVFMAWYIGLIIIVMLSMFLVILLARAQVFVGILAGIVAGLVILADLLVLAPPLFVAMTFSMNAVVIEERPVFAAIGSGFQRIFNREEFWRALLFAYASVAILMGAGAIAGIFSYVALYFHWIGAEVIVSSLFRAAFTPFSIVLLAIYYFDVRIRREGFDLEAGLERLAEGGQAA
jgi:hypothetical protein